MARHREHSAFVHHSGRLERWISGSPITTYQEIDGYKFRYICDDSLGKSTAHALDIEKYSKAYTLLNGKSGGPPPANQWEYVDYDVYLTRSVPNHISITLPSEGSSASDVLARTNPSRAEVSLPTFIGEMKDFPRMIRQAGRLALGLKTLGRSLARKGLAKEAADAYLGYKFGIAPLISDLRKLLAFQDAVDKRVKELDRLYSKGGLRRRVNLFSKVESTSSTTIVDSSLGFLLSARVMTITSVKRWATVRWIPTSPPEFKTDSEKRQYARDLVFGLNAYSLGLTAWELLPWSWFADWFLNVQNLIEAHANTVPAKAVNCCVMTHTRTTTDYSRTSHPAFSGGNATLLRETKRRALSSASLNTGLPFLNGNQLSILGALFVSRGTRR